MIHYELSFQMQNLEVDLWFMMQMWEVVSLALIYDAKLRRWVIVIHDLKRKKLIHCHSWCKRGKLCHCHSWCRSKKMGHSHSWCKSNKMVHCHAWCKRWVMQHDITSFLISWWAVLSTFPYSFRSVNDDHILAILCKSILSGVQDTAEYTLRCTHVQDTAEFECLTYIWLSDCEEKLIKVFIMFSCDVNGAILVL